MSQCQGSRQRDGRCNGRTRPGHANCRQRGTRREYKDDHQGPFHSNGSLLREGNIVLCRVCHVQPCRGLLEGGDGSAKYFLGRLRGLFPYVLMNFSRFFFQMMIHSIFRARRPSQRVFAPRFFPINSLFVGSVFGLRQYRFTCLVVFIRHRRVSLFGGLTTRRTRYLNGGRGRGRRGHGAHCGATANRCSFCGSFGGLLRAF